MTLNCPECNADRLFVEYIYTRVTDCERTNLCTCGRSSDGIAAFRC